MPDIWPPRWRRATQREIDAAMFAYPLTTPHRAFVAAVGREVATTAQVKDPENNEVIWELDIVRDGKLVVGGLGYPNEDDVKSEAIRMLRIGLCSRFKDWQGRLFDEAMRTAPRSLQRKVSVARAWILRLEGA